MGIHGRFWFRAKCIFIFSLVLIIFTQPAFAWGPVTHVAINQRAYKDRYGTETTFENDFVRAGHSPDMVSFWNIVTKQSRYDYAHNLIKLGDRHTLLDVDYDEGENQYGIPMFGKKILKAYARTKHPNRFPAGSRYFAYGWTGHQLADRDAHGTKGYASFHPLFEQFPYSRLPNHGTAELIVDAVEYEKNPALADHLSVPSTPALIHEAAIRFFNDVKYYDSSSALVRTIKRSDIINCSQAKRLAWLWAKWLGAYKYLVLLTTKSRGFPEAKEYYSDYIEKYNQSVSAVAGFLENPTYEIASSQKYPFSQRFASVFSGLFDRFRSLFRSEKVQAQEGEENQPLPETLYYTFVNDVAQEAETLGALQTQETMTVADPNVTGSKSYEFSTEVVNEEAFQQALTTVINRDLSEANPLETRLWAKFMEGLYLRSDLSFREIISRAQDFTPPTIGSPTPENGSFINDSSPVIYASVVDDPLGIGLDLASLSMRVDDMLVDHSYVEEMLPPLVLCSPSNPLPDGEHSVSIEVEDRAENKTESVWSFTIDTIPPRISHEVENKIINIKKGSKAQVKVSADEPHITYLLEVFRTKVDKREKVLTSPPKEDIAVVDWDGNDGNGQPAANGVYVLRITARDKAGNETSFEEQANVNNEAGGA